jgi:DNA repair protein RecO (recombination protein O)
MILTTDAIVLRTMRYGDTSRIATLYTKESGKMSVIAKGVRERAAKHGGALDMLACVSAVIYCKDQRELQLLSKVDRFRPFRRLSDSMEKIAAATMATELVEALTPQSEPNQRLFDTLLDALDGIDRAERNVFSVFFAFELILLELSGFRPEFSTCAECGTPANPESLPRRIAVEPRRAGFLCGSCGTAAAADITVSPGTLMSLRALQNVAAPSLAVSLSLGKESASEIGNVLKGILRTHMDHVRPLKSEAVFASMLALT